MRTKSARRRRRRSRGSNVGPLLLVGRHREALTTLATAVRKDFSAACCRHAGAEAVRAQPAEIVRLVRALHGGARKMPCPCAESSKLFLVPFPQGRVRWRQLPMSVPHLRRAFAAAVAVGLLSLATPEKVAH